MKKANVWKSFKVKYMHSNTDLKVIDIYIAVDNEIPKRIR